MSTLTKDSSHRMTLAQVAEKDMVGGQKRKSKVFKVKIIS